MGNHHQKRIYARKIAARAARPSKAKDPLTELAAPVKGGGLVVEVGFGATGGLLPVG